MESVNFLLTTQQTLWHPTHTQIVYINTEVFADSQSIPEDSELQDITYSETSASRQMQNLNYIENN